MHGRVRLARNALTGERVAIKIVEREPRRRLGAGLGAARPGGLSNVPGAGAAADPLSSLTDEKVRREIAVMKKLHHENVVQLKEVIDDPHSRKIFMVLEFMQGGDVVWKDVMGRPTMRVDEARSVLRDLVLGLEYLHYQGIIHRDIKPANLLWDEHHRVKISDFGVSHVSLANQRAAAALGDPAAVAAAAAADEVELAKTAGSPAFFAPELCVASSGASSAPRITKSIDVWALGVTLYCLLFGHVPFSAETEFALFAVIAQDDFALPEFMGADRVRIGPRAPRWAPASPDGAPPSRDAVAQAAAASRRDVPEAQLGVEARLVRDLLDRLLEKDPAKRITLEGVKQHPWVVRNLPDAHGWLQQTDPTQKPSVQVSHEEVQGAFTGFTKLKQRMKRLQSKLVETLAQRGRHRSLSTSHVAPHHAAGAAGVDDTAALGLPHPEEPPLAHYGSVAPAPVERSVSLPSSMLGISAPQRGAANAELAAPSSRMTSGGASVAPTVGGGAGAGAGGSPGAGTSAASPGASPGASSRTWASFFGLRDISTAPASPRSSAPRDFMLRTRSLPKAVPTASWLRRRNADTEAPGTPRATSQSPRPSPGPSRRPSPGPSPGDATPRGLHGGQASVDVSPPSTEAQTPLQAASAAAPPPLGPDTLPRLDSLPLPDVGRETPAEPGGPVQADDVDLDLDLSDDLSSDVGGSESGSPR